MPEHACPGLTLQVTLAPADAPHALHLLPHQLRQLGDQAERILLVVDTNRSRGRFAADFDDRAPQLDRLTGAACAEHPKAAAIEVDYSESARQRVAARFFGGAPVPANDFRGGPFYSYFFALDAVQTPFVFHIDSDIMFGGGSASWCAEAVEQLREEPEVIACSPLPGPPTADGRLLTQTAEPWRGRGHAWRFEKFSTRLFVASVDAMCEKLGPLSLPPPVRRRNRFKTRLLRRPPYALPEDIITVRMRKRGLSRIDFLGAEPGLWSLHPPFRSPEFYERLPELIRAVESNEVPEHQRGDYDLNDSMVDWSPQRRAARRSRWWS